MTKLRVAYYAHHVGSGHLRHAYNVSRHPDLDVMVMSSGQLRDHFDNFVRLEHDFVENYKQPVGGPFHYVPVGASNVKRRASQIVEALTTFNPDVVITDVSAEVAALTKLCGYPTIVRLMHGDRFDHAHTDMFDMADGIIAYFGEAIDPLSRPELRGKTTFAGMLSLPPQTSSTINGGITVLTSLGGEGVDLDALSKAASTTPNVRWTVVGQTHGSKTAANVDVLGIVDSAEPYLVKADLIVTSTGHNAVRAAINARRPMVLFPEARMYEEQVRFGEALHRAFGIPLTSAWDDAEWSTLLDTASRQHPESIAEQMLVNDDQFFSAISVAIENAIRPQ